MKEIRIKRKNKIVFDTNIWISFLFGKQIIHLENYITEFDFRILYSELLLDEIKSTLQKPKLRKYFNREHFENINSLFLTYGERIDVTSDIELCRDKK